MKHKNKNIKIGILIDQLIPGGVQKAALEEARYLATCGYNVTVIVLMTTNNKYEYQDLKQKILIRYLSDSYPFLFRKTIRIKPFTFLSTLHILGPFLTPLVIKKNEYDLLISHGTTTSLTALSLKKLKGIPYITVIWDPLLFILNKVYRTSISHLYYTFLKEIIKILEKLFIDNAKLVITPSKVHKPFIDKVYKHTSEVLYPGYIRSPLGPKKMDYFLSYTRWQLAKSPEFILEIARNFVASHFVIAGAWTDTKEYDSFMEKIRELHLKNITVVQEVDSKKLQQLAQHAQAFIHPNYESFGMTVLEMASRGVPIIVPHGSGVTELFQENKDGYFPKQGNLSEFCTAVAKLSNIRTARSMGKHIQQIATNYTWKTHGKKLEKLIETALDQTSIAVLANAFVSKLSIGGGDQILMELIKYLPHRFTCNLITPRVGYYHWSKNNLATPAHNFHILKETLFDNRLNKIAIFITYLIRSLQTTLYLLKTRPRYLYSSTENFPDVIPAYVYTLFFSRVKWISRVYHLIPSPLIRSGNFVTNTVSYVLQKMSLYLIRNSDRILVDNPLLQQSLLHLGFSKSKLEIHFGGVEYQLIRHYKRQEKYNFTACVIGRFSPHKGTHDIVPIWQEVQKKIPTATVALVGKGDDGYEREIINLIEKTGLSKHISLLGFLDYYQDNRIPLFDLLKSVRLLLFLDHEAGFGLTICKAFACGTPVIAYNLPLINKLYTGGVITVPFKKTKSFADAIIHVMQNNNRYQTLKQQTVHQAQKYDWRIQANKLAVTFYNVYR